MQAVVFGRMLTTLGTFCHCARLTPEADRLCSVVMELLLVSPPLPPRTRFPLYMSLSCCPPPFVPPSLHRLPEPVPMRTANGHAGAP